MIQAKRQTDNILKNVADGIFLIDPGYVIESQYSSALEGILIQEELGGLNFLELIENRVAPAVFTSAREYLEMMFDASVDESTLNELNPLSRIEYYHQTNGSVSEESNFLEFKVQRVVESNRIRHLIMTMKSIASRRREQDRAEEAAGFRVERRGTMSFVYS